MSTISIAMSALRACATAAALLLLPAQAGADGVKEPRDAAQVFVDATASGDVDALAGLYLQDAIFLAPNTPVIAGRDNIRGVFAHNQSLGRNAIRFTDVRTDRGPEHAVVFWTWNSEILPANGNPIRMSGRSLVYFKRVGEAWMISADMLQAAPN
jgi:ketosteroid isomerase-like protein